MILISQELQNEYLFSAARPHLLKNEKDQNTVHDHTKLESVLVFWRESVMPLVQGIHMDPK